MRFLFVDRICELDRGTRVRAVKNISWYGDFLEEIFPGCRSFLRSLPRRPRPRPCPGLSSKQKIFRSSRLSRFLIPTPARDMRSRATRLKWKGRWKVFSRKAPWPTPAFCSIKDRPLKLIMVSATCIPSKLQDPESARRQFQNLTENKVFLPAAAQVPAGLPPGASTVPATRPWVDRVIEFEAGKKIVGIRNVTGTEDYFNDHFPRRPILPGVIIMAGLTSVAQTAPRAVACCKRD